MFIYKHSLTTHRLLITPQHQELQNKYEQLLLKSMQFDAILKQRDEVIQQLQDQITPLKNAFEQLVAEVKLLREEKASLLHIIKEKDKQLGKLELIEHQYQQLTRLGTAAVARNLQQRYRVNYN